MTSESLDPELLKRLTEDEKGRIQEVDLASDGSQVQPGIEPPSEKELLEYLHAAGWDEHGPPNIAEDERGVTALHGRFEQRP